MMAPMRYVAALLAVIVVILGGCSEDDSGTGSGDEAPTLLLLPAGQQVDMFGGVEGKLDTNDQGCVVLGDQPVVVEDGTTLEQDGEQWVVKFSGGDVVLGESFKGAGGSVAADKLEVDGMDACLDEGSNSVYLLRPMS